MPAKSEREYRSMTVEVRQPEEGQEEKKVVEGYASTFNDPYVLYEDKWVTYREQISPNAFDETDMEDVIMQYDHHGRVFARNKNGTLSVGPDEIGLHMEADLGGTELGRQLYEEIDGGYTDKMSIGFKVDREADVWTRQEIDRKTVETRTINRITKLYDVSAVSIPANDATSISVRALVDGEIEKLRAERLEAERIEGERRRAEVRAKALMGGVE